MKILIIETSAAECSVAIAENGVSVFELSTYSADDEMVEQTATARSQHSILLGRYVQEALAWCDGKVDAVAVSYGPGSYTGLRIGLSTAKGLCYGMNVPLILVDSLQGLVGRALRLYGVDFQADDLLVPMIDARRMEVYTANYTTTGEQLSEIRPLIVDSESYADYRDSNKCLVLFGSGAKKCETVIAECGVKVRCLEGILAEAKDFSRVVCEMYDNEKFADLAYSEPLYLKEWQSTTKKKS